MSVQNIVNINESNPQQTLEQSMTTPVLFYFIQRSQHCSQLTPVLESLARPATRQFILGKAGLRRRTDDTAVSLVCAPS